MTSATGTLAPITAKRAGFLAEVLAIWIRALRLISRDPEAVIPALVVPVFFFAVNVGALQNLAENLPGIDYKAFQLPVAILFAATGNTRAITLVTDIQTGYFDRLSLTPVNRLALLIGFTLADVVLVAALTIPVLILGFGVGVRFESGPLGVLAFVGIAGLWAIAYSGLPYAIALKTGNPAAVNSSFLLFLPFVFLTSVFLPREAMTEWMSTVAAYNPVTYLLEGMRSLVMVGWDAEALAKALGAIGGLGVVSLGLALWALRGRVTKR